MNNYSINRFFYVVDYKIKDGSRFFWECYGPNSWSLSCSKGTYIESLYDIDVVFDRKTLLIYEVNTNFYKDYEEINYRWIHPDYREKYIQEAKDVNQDPYIAYDDVKYTDVSSFEEWESKTREIIDKYEHN